MRTMRKQFPVNWLTSASARQSEAGSINEKNGCLSGGTIMALDLIQSNSTNYHFATTGNLFIVATF